MPSPPLKQRVRASFDRAAPSYDAAAVLQRRVCERLLELLLNQPCCGATPTDVLDAGCGTGYGARLLHERWPLAQISALDFAPAMLRIAKTNHFACLAADLEALPLRAASFDLWWSSLSLQWCDPALVLREAARVLKPKGLLAVSTLGPNTFSELREAFASIDQQRHTLAFRPPDALGQTLRQLGFTRVEERREKETVYYPDLKTLLRAVKAVGAHNVGEGARQSMLGRAAWQRVETAYERHRQAAGLPASYDVILACAKNTEVQ